MGRTKNATVEVTSEDMAEDSKLTGEQKAERFYKALNAALHSVQTIGYVDHESAQNIAKWMRARMGAENSATVFGRWINDRAMDKVDFQTCMTVNAVVMNPPTVSKNPKLSETERWQARLYIINRAYVGIINDMRGAELSDTFIDEMELTVRGAEYVFPEHLNDRIEAVKNAAYVGTVDRGRKSAE